MHNATKLKKTSLRQRNSRVSDDIFKLICLKIPLSWFKPPWNYSITVQLIIISINWNIHIALTPCRLQAVIWSSYGLISYLLTHILIAWPRRVKLLFICLWFPVAKHCILVHACGAISRGPNKTVSSLRSYHSRRLSKCSIMQQCFDDLLEMMTTLLCH